MDAIIGLVLAATISLILAGGYLEFSGQETAYSSADNAARQEALDLIRFDEALNTYVQDNLQNSQINWATPISASTIGLPTSAGTDVLGQTLVGYVAAPWNTPQSWLVLPSASSNATPDYGQYGLATPQQMQTWAALVARDVATLSNGTITGYTYEVDSQVFREPGSQDVSQMSHYFPDTGVAVPQQVPAIVAGLGYEPMASTNLAAAVGYWVWALQLYNQWGSQCTSSSSGTNCTVQEELYPVGYSPGCPEAGLTPQPFSGVDSAEAWPALVLTDPSLEANFQTTYLCLPLPQSTYNQITASLDLSQACQSSGQGCTAYLSNGTQIGYTSSCQGLACQTENLNLGEGYNPGNNGYPQGENTSESTWVGDAYNQAATYLYGSVLFEFPGGQEYTVLWGSGFNYDMGANWWNTADTVGLYSGDVVQQPVTTAINNANGYMAKAWPFTVVGDPSDVGSSQNQNYTVLNLD